MYKAEHSVKSRGLLSNEILGHERFVNSMITENIWEGWFCQVAESMGSGIRISYTGCVIRRKLFIPLCLSFLT